MLRRIVVTRSHEPLGDAFRARSFGPAGPTLRQWVKVRGMEFDEKLHPVRIPGAPALRLLQPQAAGFDYRDLARPQAPEAFAVRAQFDDQEAIERLRADRKGEVIGVFADPTIQACPTYCGVGAVGDSRDVARVLGVTALRKARLSGRNVRIAIVDTGIDGQRIPNVRDGWSADGQYQPGSAGVDHGTMCAFDARIAAPDADLLDYALLLNAAALSSFLSDAIAAFADLIARLQAQPGPLVVNNSWAVFDRSEDAPIGSPENYSANPDHPFNQITGSLVEAGADVLFAAGNCGRECPDDRCGRGDTGPDASIHGANSHPDVITVAAITIDGRRLGYSSQGGGGLARRKPDVAAPSHFAGSGVYDADGGTSAACPVAAGVVAALRQHKDVKALAPARVKAMLQKSAVRSDGKGWDTDLGYGTLSATRALKEAGISAAAGVAAAAPARPAQPLPVARLAASPVKRAAAPVKRAGAARAGATRAAAVRRRPKGAGKRTRKGK
jgi:subtilisin family serine protease